MLFVCNLIYDCTMKLKITPTQRETVLQEDEMIISKTDTKGKITYTNRTFMNISLLSETELLGIQHNIIRHPDMPRAAFKMLWDNLQNGEEYFAYIKNICKDGGFYWVLANVTPDYDQQGKLLGYYSVRRRPSPEAIATVTPIYKRMLEIESQHSPKEALQKSLNFLHNHLKEQGLTYNQFIYQLMQREGYL